MNNDKNLKEDLKFILNDVIEWLKFAEAKHIGLITLNLAFLAISFDLLSNNIFKNFKFFIFSIILCNIVCLGISILSFLPQVTNLKLINKLLVNYISSSNNDNNLLFYKVIARFNNLEYLTKLIERDFSEEFNIDSVSNFTKDLSTQIISISKLCCAKYYLFSVSLKLLILPCILFISLIIIA